MLLLTKIFLKFITVLIIFKCTESNVEIKQANKLLERSKRYLIYYKGGLFKIVIGYAMPIKLGSKQSLAVAVNLQWQYSVITNLTQAHKSYPPIVGRRSISAAHTTTPRRYSDRQLTYFGLEAVLDKYGFPGRECLLKSICENAMNSLGHDGNAVIGQLFHIILTPDYNTKEPDVDSEYMDAKYAGYFGVDCSSLYSKCTINTIDFLDIFTQATFKVFK